MAILPISKLERRIDGLEQNLLILSTQVGSLSEYIKEKNNYQEKSIDNITNSLNGISSRIDSLLIKNK